MVRLHTYEVCLGSLYKSKPAWGLRDSCQEFVILNMLGGPTWNVRSVSSYGGGGIACLMASIW
jgi:hypothetical protein